MLFNVFHMNFLLLLKWIYCIKIIQFVRHCFPVSLVNCSGWFAVWSWSVFFFTGGHSQWSGGVGHWRRPGTLHSQQRSSKTTGFHCKIQASIWLRQESTYFAESFLICDHYQNHKTLGFTAIIHTMAPMTTLKWSFRSLLENTSTCMETWMMMASMKVSLK